MSSDVYSVSECKQCADGLTVAYSEQWEKSLEEQQWMTYAEKTDFVFVRDLSYVPNLSQIDYFRALSSAAIKQDEDGVYVASKGPKPVQHLFCEKAPWNKPEAQRTVQVETNHHFAFVRDGADNDNKFPLSVPQGKPPSMGPNGVLIEFDGTYGTQRFNLFQGSREDVQSLIDDFLRFRDENEISVLRCIVDHMRQGRASTPRPAHVTPDFVNATGLLERCLGLFEASSEESSAGVPKTLRDVGLGLVSFCQTWDKDSFVSGKPPVANFSIPSPHFQTRVVILDGVKLFKRLMGAEAGGNLETKVDEIGVLFTAYANTVRRVTDEFKKADYSKKFVYLDGMRSRSTTSFLFTIP